MRPSAKNLFTAYFQVGISSFGGANAWARRMLVEKRGWLTDREFAERLGLGQVLPGPNIVNMALGHLDAKRKNITSTCKAAPTRFNSSCATIWMVDHAVTARIHLDAAGALLFTERDGANYLFIFFS